MHTLFLSCSKGALTGSTKSLRLSVPHLPANTQVRPHILGPCLHQPARCHISYSCVPCVPCRLPKCVVYDFQVTFPSFLDQTPPI